MKVLATFFSIVLHPLLMPIYVFGFAFFFIPQLFSPIKQQKLFPFLGLIAIATFVLPSLFVLLLYRLGLVSKLNIEDRKDRFIPHVLSSTIYVSTTWFFYSKIGLVPNFYIIMGTITLCMILVSIINFFWKISAHSTAMGGISAFFISMFLLYNNDNFLIFFSLAIIFSGIVMSSRLYLQVHTISQVCGGFALGVLVGMLGLINIS